MQGPQWCTQVGHCPARGARGHRARLRAGRRVVGVHQWAGSRGRLGAAAAVSGGSWPHMVWSQQVLSLLVEQAPGLAPHDGPP